MKRAADDDLCGSSVGVEPKRVNLVERNGTPHNYQMLNSYNVGKHSSLDLVELAREIQSANVALHSQGGKLGLIVDQIRFLQSQALQILRDTKTDQCLHKAACNFKKIPGQIYYLYERESGQQYFSMLSPEEWGMNLSHRFVGGYRLELDQTWTAINRINEVDEKRQITRKLLEADEIPDIFERAIKYSPERMDSS